MVAKICIMGYNTRQPLASTTFFRESMNDGLHGRIHGRLSLCANGERHGNPKIWYSVVRGQNQPAEKDPMCLVFNPSLCKSHICIS